MTELLKLLAEYGAKTGIGEIGLAEDGICTLSYDDRVVLHIAPTAVENEVMFYAGVGSVAEEYQLAAYQHVLAANLLGATTAGGTLALDERDSSLILILRTDVSALSYPNFEQLLEALVESIEYWQGEVSSFADSDASQPADALDALPAGVRV